ncbi:glucosamine-6-phosphate deaminase [Clostridium swellfunianum]|uniref:glucosamine-6-phosphate deaminase n=1 Tax=Clostridium swellfunianum TaxID=1367462 RepID=UPI00202F2F93|nr:glucosamine-6-phosphate deaminase [Clostridium swellfunianum]MCM0650891.1 glucosamine-6-phosphate deaminase [Clostridium swellfunianum]
MSIIKEFQRDKLKVKVFDNRISMGASAAIEAADLIKRLLNRKNEINIVFAAAPSQNDFLEALIDMKGIDWNCINAFHMDEYIGLEPSAPQSFGNFLKAKIFDKVKFKSINYINGNDEDVQMECKRYSKLISCNDIDIVFMGIGENGHIAFNDPHVALFNDKEIVKAVELDEKCRKQQVNDGCFTSMEAVPTHALTLTIPALFSGKHIFCIVPAKTKAEAVYNTINGDITEACPASILRRHDKAVLYADTDSASLLI